MTIRSFLWAMSVGLAVATTAAGCGDSPQTSSSSHWLVCGSFADCSAPTAVACTGGYCVDSKGERVPDSTSGRSTGGASGSGSAGGMGGGTGGGTGGGAGSTAPIDAGASGSPGPSSGGTPAPTGVGGGSPVAAPSDASPTVYGPGCPQSLPTSGSCSNEGRLCTYGETTRDECRDRAVCTGGQWVATRPNCALPSPASDCPAVLDGNDCAIAGQVCRWDHAANTPFGTECECFEFSIPGQVTKVWMCEIPQSRKTTDCPPIVPNAGAQCSPPNVQCQYLCGQLSENRVQAQCGADGTWTWTEASCNTEHDEVDAGQPD